MKPVVEVGALELDVATRGTRRLLLDGLDFSIAPGEVLGLVGESGSGKSTTARVLLGALPPGATVRGSALLDGQDVLAMRPAELRILRSRRVVMIGQNPRAAMNPVRTVGEYALEALRTNLKIAKAEASDRICALLSRVGIENPEPVLHQFPHQLSGGMLQRVVIAAALAVEPALIIADEPTSALDTLSQADVVGILNRVRERRDVSMLFITHDLDLAALVCDRTAVMYAGRIVETQPSRGLLHHPQHPYAAGLMTARTRVDVDIDRLRTIPGLPIAAYDKPAGCAFHPRCVFAKDRCRELAPPLRATPSGEVACWRAEELAPQLAHESDEWSHA